MKILQFLINSLILSLIFLFIQIKHPLTVGLMLLIQTFLISIIIGIIFKTFWFSYILFLIFLGGMLIIFIYITTLSSNEIFSLNNKTWILYLFIIIILTIIIILLDINYYCFINNYEIIILFDINIIIDENSINLNKIYSYPTNFLTLFIIIYLFLTLIIAVKITNFFLGPLRPIFN